ncbi:unnamed protein product [Brugia timori]|uniref:Ovule protein n=1 Tax=Brugia timori TaxID=42155 RepID=A0A0R3QXY5_9BILA|nr:unnamed protein product [Brugia timori]
MILLPGWKNIRICHHQLMLHQICPLSHYLTTLILLKVHFLNSVKHFRSSSVVHDTKKVAASDEIDKCSINDLCLM